MCGRLASFLPPEAIRAVFRTTNSLVNLPPSWNMAPTDPAIVIRPHPESGERHLEVLWWGLIPYFTKDLKAARKPINARAETAGSSAMFRDALARRRCLVPADAFYEWASHGGREAALRHRAAGRRADGFRRLVGGLGGRRTAARDGSPR